MRINPFDNYMPVDTPQRFYGREKIVSRILKNISSGPKSKEIIGLTRIGKTSLLNIIGCSNNPMYGKLFDSSGVELETLKNTIFVKVDFQGLSTDNFWEFLGLQLQKSVAEQLTERKTGPLWKAITDFGDFSEVLPQLNTSVQRIVFLFDEFDRFVTNATSDILENLRMILNEYRFVAYVTATRKRLYEYYEERSEQVSTSPLYNVFEPTPVFVGLMDDTDHPLKTMAYDAAKAEGVEFSDRDMTLIRDLGGLHPDLTRLVCNKLFDLRLDNSSASIDPENVFQRVASDFEPTFSSITRELSESQSKILLDITNHKVVNLSDIDENHLVDLGLVIVRENQPYIFSPIYEDLLRKHSTDKGNVGYPIIWPDQRAITWGNKLWILPQNEWKIFSYLWDRIGQVCTREELVLQISSEREKASDAALDIVASRVRQKLSLEPIAPQLLTIRGVGYMLQVRNLLPTKNE